MLAHYSKANEVHDVKLCEQKKNIKNKAVQTKIKFIYQQIHEKENITNILI